MSAQKPRITIVGLGLIGGSIGLALRQAGVASAVVGHDKSADVNSQAKKLAVVDQTEWRLIPACEKADLVILATPVGAIEETLRVIGQDLKPGCVVMDTASLKAPVLAWADQLLPSHVHFIGMDPILSKPLQGAGGLESARADLFQGGLFCICPAGAADSEAVRLAIDLVTILGAKPLFYDPLEHDGLLAAVDHLPSVLALALLEMAVQQPTWRELRKVAGPGFELATRAVDLDPASQTALCSANRDNILRWIDSFSAALDSIRQTLFEGEADVLGDRFGEALKERGKWLRDRATGDWEEGERPEMPPKPNVLDSLLGTFWSRRLRREPKQGGG